MLLGFIIPIISDIIELFLSVKGALSSIESLIGSNSYNIFYTENKLLIEIIAVSIIVLIISCNSIKRNSVKVDYRIKGYPMDFDLHIGNLTQNLIQRQTEIIEFIFEKENPKSLWIWFLNMIDLIFLVKIEYPLGITIGIEEEHLPRDVRHIGDTLQSVSYTIPLHANGRRRISFDVSLDGDNSFAGNEPIFIKTYITSDNSFLIKFKIEVGNNSINILP